MENDQPLDAWLEEVAQADFADAPSPGLEARTLAAWDVWRGEQHGSSSRPAGLRPQLRAWRVPGFAAIAAAILVGLVIARPGPDAGPIPAGDDREIQPADATSREATGEVVSGRPAEPVAAASGERDGRLPSGASAAKATTRRPRERLVKHRAAQRPATNNRPPPVAAAPDVETASFVLLGPDLEREPSGTFQLARVRVSREVLVDLGLLLDGHRGGEPVQADVVFGEDGLAKAIRLTPAAVISGRTP